MGKMQIGRWGNSLAVRLPKELVDRYQLQEGGEIDTAALCEALAQAEQKETASRRAAAIAEIRERRWTLADDWKFDRDEANWRPAMDRW